MTKLEAIKELITYDHSFLSPKGVRHFGEPFDFFETDKVRDNRSELKGLNASAMGVEEGEMAEGMDASVLAMRLCKKEGVKYPPMYGRGSQLRVACHCLIKHLEKQ